MNRKKVTQFKHFYSGLLNNFSRSLFSDFGFGYIRGGREGAIPIFLSILNQKEFRLSSIDKYNRQAVYYYFFTVNYAKSSVLADVAEFPGKIQRCDVTVRRWPI